MIFEDTWPEPFQRTGYQVERFLQYTSIERLSV